MALVVKDRVQETTTTTGTGTVTLAGAVAGFQTFAAIGDGNTTYYAITSGNDWEVGIGTYTASGTTLSRDTILESSNAGSAITLSGTSNVFVTYPAEKSVNSDDIGVSVQAYDADTAKYDDVTANFTGTLQNGGSNVLVDSDIGVNVQGYDADTAKYDDTTANFTGTLQQGGDNVLTSGPAFQAQGPAVTQSFSSGTWTKAQMSVEDFDTDSCYNTSLYRFTPNKAGYYFVHFAGYTLPSSGGTNMRNVVYKNGSVTSIYGLLFVSGARGQAGATGIIYMNGTTDYLEPYVYNNGTSPELANGSASTFAAYYVRP
jgi:hypothetical protein